MFLAALVLSLGLTPLTARLSALLGAVDHPDERKIHAKAVPRLGGLAMVFALAVPLLLFLSLDRKLAGFLLGALIVSAAGLVDDIRRIPPAAKFACEVVAASVFVGISGATLGSLGDVFALGEVRTGAMSPFVTVFCMVGVMNALNLSDGLDGLAGGISAIACLFLGAFSYLNGDWFSVSLALCLLGGVIGFLRYNTYPASLFMGDTGSLLLGYSLGAIAVLMVQSDATAFRVTPVMVGTVLALPIVDTLMVMVRRVWLGGNPFHPDKTHLHHRLMNLGVPHEMVVPILYIAMGAFGFLARVTHSWAEGAAFGAVLLFGGIIYGLTFLAQRRAWRLEKPGSSVWVARWGIMIGLLIPVIAFGPVFRTLSLIALAAGSFVAAISPWGSGR
jgi:UDP-GlcNAc:undecaprenyl-phosphate GlcNAc-1-phosphate transferase